VLLDFLQEFQLPAVYYSEPACETASLPIWRRAMWVRNWRAEPRPAPGSGRDGPPIWRSLEHARKVAAIIPCFLPLCSRCIPAGRLRQLLEAAAYLVDVGHYVSDSGHHKHSYYVIANSDIAGFTARERLLIASLCRYHRKSLPMRCTARIRRSPR